jgi:hypothetical protein
LADASLIEAHAPPAIERDTPAKPIAGKALLRRLLFEERFDMAQSPSVWGTLNQSRYCYVTFRLDPAQVPKKLGIAQARRIAANIAELPELLPNSAWCT